MTRTDYRFSRSYLFIIGVGIIGIGVRRSAVADEPKSIQWWQTLPAVIAGLATLITALAGLIAALNQIGLFRPSSQPVSSPQAIASPSDLPLVSRSPEVPSTPSRPKQTPRVDDAGKSVPDATTSDQNALILRILKAMETHDYRAFLTYTVDKETDYFGHKNSSSAFIQQDMTQDARSYKWCRFVPDLSTFETSLGHDSIEYDSDALDVQGKEHKARCRLDIYYSATTPPRLQALSLKVLRN
jgi:hypothetical protein